MKFKQIGENEKYPELKSITKTNSEFRLQYLKMELPTKGKNLIAVCSDGIEREIFRCACKDDNCTEWRCAITGYRLMIDVVSWKYKEL